MLDVGRYVVCLVPEETVTRVSCVVRKQKIRVMETLEEGTQIPEEGEQSRTTAKKIAMK
jgi:hypothetical protein